MFKSLSVALVSVASVIAIAPDARPSPSAGQAAARSTTQGPSEQIGKQVGGITRPPPKTPPRCGPTSGCRASLETGTGGEVKWLEVFLSAEEQASLAGAFATAKLEQTPHVHLRHTGQILEFVADTSAVETPDAVNYRAVLKVDDMPVRIVPEGTAYDVLIGRVKSPKK